MGRFAIQNAVLENTRRYFLKNVLRCDHCTRTDSKSGNLSQQTRCTWNVILYIHWIRATLAIHRDKKMTRK
jgi:hypothetical protein